MKATKLLESLSAFCALAGLLALSVGVAPPVEAASFTRLITSSGTATLQSAAEGSDTLQIPEFDPRKKALINADGAEATGFAARAAANRFAGRGVNRSIARNTGFGSRVESSRRAKSRPKRDLSFDGLNFRQQRLANGGNQFSVEPPDQALCVANGYVLESVNTVLRVYDTAGNPLTGVIDLNTFYGYPPAINRATGEIGPFLFDPVCYFDHDTQRWFHVIVTIDVGDTGSNHLDIAVSTTDSPLGPWNIYRLPVQNDGSQGTPVHADCPCLGDYPHIGADKYGIYITTNEFPFAGGFNSAQIYALPKRALAAGVVSVPVTLIDTIDHLLDGTPGFTVWPATSPHSQYEDENRGTEYFLSSQAVFNDSGTDNRLRIWALTNTKSLESRHPNPFLTHNVINVNQYGVPPLSDQKPGDFPLGQCINDTTLLTPFGPGCWQFLFVDEPAHDEVLSPLDSNDSRMQQVIFANGKLWGALDTAVNVGGQERAGIAYYIIKPEVERHVVTGKVRLEGVLALENNNLSYPAIAVLPNGKGVMAFTLVGADHHPSAAYVGLNARVGAGEIHVAAEGVGAQDGFTGYKAFVGDPPRPRWGDYGAAVADGKSIWIASEYINQTCTLAEYVSPPFGSCGGTRATLGNWGTRITKITP